MMRRTFGIVGLLCSIDKIDNGRPTAFIGHHVKEEKDEVNYATIYPINILDTKYRLKVTSFAKPAESGLPTGLTARPH